jgi:ABC-type uncharacterized transport system substrate-binding protein
LELGGSINKIKEGNYDLICPLGTLPAKTIISQISDKPVIFSMVLNPWENGLLDAAAQAHSTNFTGVVLDVGLEEQFKFLKEVLPQEVNIGIIYGPITAKSVEGSFSRQKELGIKIIPLKVKVATDVPRVLEEINPERIDMLWLVPDWEIYTANTLKYLVGYSFEKKIPLMSFSVPLVKLGAIFGYVHDFPGLGRQAAGLVIRILKGELPKNIALVYPEKINYVLNLKSMRYFKKELSREALLKFQETF